MVCGETHLEQLGDIWQWEGADAGVASAAITLITAINQSLPKPLGMNDAMVSLSNGTAAGLAVLPYSVKFQLSFSFIEHSFFKV